MYDAVPLRPGADDDNDVIDADSPRAWERLSAAIFEVRLPSIVEGGRYLRVCGRVSVCVRECASDQLSGPCELAPSKGDEKNTTA